MINFYFNLLNILNCLDGGLGMNMRKAAHPSCGMGSSNPERLQHYGDVVCHVVCVFL